jgi:hypothetical protein
MEIFKTKDISNATHFIMTNGKLSVPSHKYEFFIDLYLKSLVSGLYIVERFGNIFRFFLDIDKHNEHSENIIAKIVEKYNKDFILLKCTSNKGYHVIFPEWFVDIANASMYATKISNILPVDVGVYKGHSLRMPGSLKPNENRSYMPLGFTKNGEFLHCNILSHQLLKQCCISPPDTPKQTSVQLENTIPISFNNSLLQELIRNTELENYYKTSKITRVTKLGKYFVLVSNSHWCQNIQDHHKSNYVYFVVSPDKCIRQKCFCRCAHRTCSIYKGKKYPISYNSYLSLSTRSHV